MTAQKLPVPRSPERSRTGEVGPKKLNSNNKRPRYSILEAAKFLGISPSTLRRWEREGRLKARRALNGELYYTQEQIDVLRGEEGKDFYPISKAAKLLGVSPSTLRRWEREGKLKPMRTLGGDRRYALRDIETLLKNQSDISKVINRINHVINGGGAGVRRAQAGLPVPGRVAPLKRFSLALIGLVFFALVLSWLSLTPLAQTRIQRAFGDPLQSLVYSVAQMVAPGKAELYRPGPPQPIIDVNDPFQYLEFIELDE